MNQTAKAYDLTHQRWCCHDEPVVKCICGVDVVDILVGAGLARETSEDFAGGTHVGGSVKVSGVTWKRMR